MLLRLYGHAVETALGGPAALRAARANPPEVVLLDISMPGMDGYEVVRRLRSMFQDRVVLIALTAHGFEEDERRCVEAGFDRHLVKPADPVKVEQLLRRIGSFALGRFNLGRCHTAISSQKCRTRKPVDVLAALYNLRQFTPASTGHRQSNTRSFVNSMSARSFCRAPSSTGLVRW